MNLSIHIAAIAAGLPHSADGGDRWVNQRKEFTEVRGMVWTNN